MDNHPTPFPAGKSQSLKSKNRKIINAPKISVKEKEPHVKDNRQRRAFGTIQNLNMPSKPVVKKPLNEKKPWLRVSQKQPPPTAAETTPPTKIDPSTPVPPIDTAQKSSEKNRAKLKKKSLNLEKKVPKNSGKGDVFDPSTPAKSPLTNKPRVSSGTPYQTAQKCSNCRYDRLESSSYWISQIKLSESVKKHFASAAFFRLAFESKAEPVRNLRIELKKYMARHEYLAHVDEWRDLSRSYGLLKDENDEVEVDSGCQIARSGMLDYTQGVSSQQLKELELSEEAEDAEDNKSN